MTDLSELKRLAEQVGRETHWYAQGSALEDFREAACPDAILALIAENERLREEHDKAWRRAGVAEESVKAAAQYIIRYSWLRKQVERRNPDLFVVNQNIGHDWIQVYDLDRAIDDAIEREEP